MQCHFSADKIQRVFLVFGQDGFREEATGDGLVNDLWGQQIRLYDCAYQDASVLLELGQNGTQWVRAAVFSEWHGWQADRCEQWEGQWWRSLMESALEELEYWRTWKKCGPEEMLAGEGGPGFPANSEKVNIFSGRKLRMYSLQAAARQS